VDVEDGRVTSVRGDPDDPMSRGFVCPKVVGMKELHEDPDRLRQPVIREGDGFREVSWTEALEHAGSGLRAVRQRHGKDALALYQGNPTAHNLGLLTVGQVVMRSFGTKNLYSASSADQAPQMLAAEEMFGNPVLMPVPDLDRTDFLLIVGANPLVSNGSIMTAPNMKDRLAAIRERGGKVVVVDPRRTETARVADEHIFVRPASDPCFLLSLMHVVFAEGLTRSEALYGRCTGWAELEALAAEFAPERTVEISGVQPDVVRRLARGFAGAERASAYGRVGICHQKHGTLAAWLIYALNVVTGNLDRAGGAMFTTPAVDVRKLVRLLGFVGHDRWKSRVRGYGEVAGELPIATLADEIDTPGEGQVRALLTCAGNPVLSAPNGNRIDDSLSRLEFMVSLDGYINETTRHANVILPPASGLERSHYDVALNAFTVRNVAKFVAAPLERPPGVLHDWEILLELAWRIRWDGWRLGKWLRPNAMRVGAAIGPEGMLDVLLRTGPQRLSLSKLRASPHGLDLGPLEPSLSRVLETPGQVIRLCPARFAEEARTMLDDADAAELARRAMPAGSEAGLVLIGRRHLRSNNSWMHNTQALVKGPERCNLLMHPDDAHRLGLEAGGRVEVRSRVGSVVVPLEVSDEVMVGVVSLPHGFGHDRPGVAMRVAKQYAGVSLNDLTDDRMLDVMSGNAAFSGVPVQVRAMA